MQFIYTEISETAAEAMLKLHSWK